MVTAEFEAVGSVNDLRESSPVSVRVGDRSIGLFYHDGTFYATDTRCPHMGFPLTDGTVENGILTCPWHHARFELGCGDTFDPFADDVRTYPVEIDDDTVYVRPTPMNAVDPIEHWMDRLEHGLEEALDLIIAKSVIGLMDEGIDGAEPIRTGTSFGTQYRSAGWGSGLTTLGVMAVLADRVSPEDRSRALYVGLSSVADDCVGEPPFFPQDPLENRNVDRNRLETWFRETIEVRDADGAERVIRATIGADHSPATVAAFFVTAATDHRFLDTGHQLDFINKAFEVLDVIGWDHADTVLPSLIPGLAAADRAEEDSAWRQPIDIAALVADANDRLPSAIESGAGKTWTEPDELLPVVLGDEPHAILNTLLEAIAAGASAEELGRSVATAGARRIAQFGTANEFRDWNTVHHTYSYANAVCGLAERTESQALYRAIFDGAMRIYLDRFLNVPPTPLPHPDGIDESPDAILTELDAVFDVESDDSVDEAGELTAAYLDAGGDPEMLVHRFGSILLREDVGFHPRQNLEAAVSMADRESDPSRKRIHLIAAARYLAAHTPTRRAGEQTFRIAERLNRGERIHEASLSDSRS